MRLLITITLLSCTSAFTFNASPSKIPYRQRSASLLSSSAVQSQFPSRRTQLARATASLSLALFDPPRWAYAEDDILEDKGFITTPSGLLYKVIKEGSGDFPIRGQKVTVHYTLRLGSFTGSVFDSSKAPFRGPFSFFPGTGQVIKGWDEALLHMRVGEIRQLIVPPELGYGANGVGGKIPGGAKLYFDLEFLSSEPFIPSGSQLRWLQDHPQATLQDLPLFLLRI